MLFFQTSPRLTCQLHQCKQMIFLLELILEELSFVLLRRYVCGNLFLQVLVLLTNQGVFVLLLLGVEIDTHFHMEIRPNKNENLSEIMKYIKQKFTQWINRTFNLEGSAWKDRFFSRIIEDFTDLVRVFIYIEENPIKAGLAKRSEEYPFYEVWEEITENTYQLKE